MNDLKIGDRVQLIYKQGGTIGLVGVIKEIKINKYGIQECDVTLDNDRQLLCLGNELKKIG
jgi:hypothetical protein